jgi:putative ABC transport system permease protein
MAIRFSLGAGRSRVVRQLLTENLLLWVVAGAAGLLLSAWGVRLLRPFVGPVLPGFPQFNPIAINLRAIAYGLVMTFVSGLVFGLLPALQGSRLDIVTVLKEGGRGLISSRQMHYWRKALIVCEVGFCVVLLLGAGLLLKSLERLTSQPLGFRTGNDVTFKLELVSEKYKQPVERSLFYDRLLDQIRHFPGVESVGATSALPLNGTMVFGFSVLGRPSNGANFMPAGFEAISPDYFHAIGMPVLAGRTFTELDSEQSGRVALINQTLAHRYFANEDPIGKRVKVGYATSGAPWMTIVGVVGDVKHAGLDWDYLPEIYLPYRQLDRLVYGSFASAMFFVVRLQGRFSVDNQIRAAVSSLDCGVPVADMIGTNEIIARKQLPSQSNSAIFTVFAGISLVLAAVGLYAIVSQTVVQRRREIGIRMALGAQACDVIVGTMREGIVLALAGSAVGVAGGLLLTRLIRSMLFGVTTTDPLVFVGVPVMLLAVAALASLLPALRAASGDPLEVLRCE